MPLVYEHRIKGDADVMAGYEDLLRAAEALEARALRGDPVARAQLIAVQRILFDFEASYKRMAVDVAAKATAAIQAKIRATAVRPPTSGRLEAAIVSRPLPTLIPLGAVGIADHAELDKVRNPRAPRARPYWRAQEFGYTGNVGRIVPGYFQPGNARPNAADFRVHPRFEQVGPRAPKGTPAMRITRPIEARHFLRDGYREAVGLAQRENRRIQRELVTQLRRI